jgi:miniconductance mechanosensitive channel
MREIFDSLWDAWRLDDNWQHFAVWVLAVVSIVVMSYIVGWVVRAVIGTFIARVAAKTENQWDDFLFNKQFFHKLGNFLPAVASYFLFVSLVTPDPSVFPVIKKIILLLICVAGTSFVDQLISNAEKGFLGILGDKKIPIRSYVQVAKIFLFLVAGILIFSVLLDQNPLGILTGLGALTAVLLLVFKDSLLGFMASLQVNTNNLVQIGDWIEFPGQGIDGEVIDIALSIVKIKSGDNTVYSLPTYNLVSVPFKNWRNVSEIGARRLKLAFPLDALTLAPVTPTLEKTLRGAGLWNVPADLTDVTNAEAFRFWAQDYLERHGDVHPDLVRLVKIGDPTGRGLPLEMVFYTRLTGYPAFEHLHSRLLCHYLATLSAFGLRVFQEPVGVLKA